MDRRQAIKKLAAGTALAAGGSVVLSSRDVAYAASTPGTELVNVPGPNEDLPLVVNSSNGLVTYGDASNPTCASGSLDRSYSWTIVSLQLKGGKKATSKLEIRNSTNTETIRDSVGGYSNPNKDHGNVVLRKVSASGVPEQLENADKFVVGLIVTWRCMGAASYVEAVYVFDGKYNKLPKISVETYDVV